MTLLASFKSSITRKLLAHFFAHPGDVLYTNQIASTLNLDKRNLVKKLRELETAGLFKKEARGNLKLYSINTQYPLYNEYRSIVLSSLPAKTSVQ